jgi:uncharacterized protein YggE
MIAPLRNFSMTLISTDNTPRIDTVLRRARRRARLCAALAASLAVALVLPAVAKAQLPGLPGEPGITVEGSGEARTVPDVVEINLKLSARGELTDDAVVKHRDARKRALETFKALKLENLKIEEKDLSLRPGNAQEMWQMMWNGMPASQNKRTQIEVGSTLRARLVDVGKVPTEELMSTIGKLLDAAQDSGAGLGLSDADMMMMRYYGGGVQQNSLVKFVVTNVGEIREKAYDTAVADARKRAERLARLNGVKLGAVLAVDELVTGGMRYNPYYGGYDSGDDAKENHEEVTAETLSGGHIRIKLRVRYAIDAAGAADKTAKAEKEPSKPVAVKEQK